MRIVICIKITIDRKVDVPLELPLYPNMKITYVVSNLTIILVYVYIYLYVLRLSIKLA